MWWELLIAGTGVAGGAAGLVAAAKARKRLRETEAALEEHLRGLNDQVARDLRAIESLQRDFSALMERCGVGVLFLDGRGVIQRSNGVARQLLAPPAPDIEGRRLIEATLSEDLESLFRSVNESGSPQVRELRPAAGVGNSLVVTVAPVAAAGGEGRFLVVARDVTELRRLETVRRDFVANVSHELRTPLTSIRAMAETLSDGAIEDMAVASKFLATIVNETQRLTRIAEDLLVLSDAESRVCEKAPVSLSRMIENIVGRFEQQAEKAGITLTQEIEAGIEALASADQLEQVVVNLIDNAIKYTGSGGSVHVSAESRDGFAEVHVSDTGIGIMSKDLPRIFERFYRVDKARSRQSGGTGLGLSIVKHIVEAHGGSVTVESEHNRGSVFTVTIPLAATVEEAVASSGEPISQIGT